MSLALTSSLTEDPHWERLSRRLFLTSETNPDGWISFSSQGKVVQSRFILQEQDSSFHFIAILGLDSQSWLNIRSRALLLEAKAT